MKNPIWQQAAHLFLPAFSLHLHCHQILSGGQRSPLSLFLAGLQPASIGTNTNQQATESRQKAELDLNPRKNHRAAQRNQKCYFNKRPFFKIRRRVDPSYLSRLKQCRSRTVTSSSASVGTVMCCVYDGLSHFSTIDSATRVTPHAQNAVPAGYKPPTVRGNS